MAVMYADREHYQTTVSDSSDGTLLVAARNGSRAAFGNLVERHHGPLLRVLTRLVGDPDLAADLVQDTFVEALRCLDRVDEDRPFGGWLYGIARNLVRREHRTRRIRRVLSLDWLRERGSDTFQALHQQDGSESTARCDLLQRALDDLSPILREVLLLHRLWGFTHREIACILAISPTAAEQRVTRANALFRQRYTAHERGTR